MNTAAPFLIMGVAILVAVMLSYSTVRKIIHIRRTPTCCIGALPSEGWVEVAGQTGNATTRSPITGTVCVLWQVEIQEQRSSGKGSHWVTVYKGTSTECFYVIDETGKVLVDPSRADLVLRDDVKRTWGLFQTLDTQTITAVESLGVGTTNFLGLHKKLRVYERYIYPGESIFVLGGLQGSDRDKAIRSVGGNLFVISDRSEADVLKALYGRAAIRVLLPILMGGIVIGFLIR
jgi:hypothetical protein